MSEFKSTFEYKLIYIFRINDEQHKGLLKIGDATVHTDKSAAELFPNCKELNKAAKDRINEYTKTASIEYELLYTELAIKNISNSGMPKAFRDKAVHNVLLRSGVKRHEFKIENAGKEWLEHYFNVIGNLNYEEIIDKFSGQDKLICKTLLSYINAGSHTINDDFHLSISNEMVDKYKGVFKKIFESAGQLDHYNMMMRP